jgi:hypothetical protein
MKARARTGAKKKVEKIYLYPSTAAEIREGMGITPREMLIARRAVAEVLGEDPDTVVVPGLSPRQTRRIVSGIRTSNRRAKAPKRKESVRAATKRS